jgi:Uma2 family endonuclease
MSLADFDHAEVQDGYLYELGRGRIVVSDVPGPSHLHLITAMRRQLAVFDVAHPGKIHDIPGGSDCKIMAEGFESERHPDLAVYLTPPTEEGDHVWWTWIPALVIEVISSGSETRDYHEKAEEYLAFGVQEYWVVDADKRQVLVHRRVGGQWRKQAVKAPQTYRCCVLPGFVLKTRPLFATAPGGKRPRKKP